MRTLYQWGLALLLGPAILPVPGLAAGHGGVQWQPPLEIAAGRGERGPWRQNDSRYDYVDDPAVSLDPRGAAALAWADQRAKDVYFLAIGPDGHRLGPPVNVSRSPATFSWLPRIVHAPDEPGVLYVLWQEIVFSGGSHGGEILFARSTDGGASFSAPENLSRSAAGDGKGRITRSHWDNGSLALAAGPGGALWAAWTEYEGRLWVRRSSDGGRRFAPALHVAGDRARPARAPALAHGAQGEVYLAWTLGEDAAADIRVARSDDGGASFAEPRIVSSSAQYSDAPKIAVDGRGKLHVVYAEEGAVRYSGSLDGARSFSPPRTPIGRGGAFPQLALDGAGRVYVLWERIAGPGQRPRGLAFARSEDGGGSFSAPATVPGSLPPPAWYNGSWQGLLMQKLAVNASGEIAVVSSALREGEASRVVLIRGRPPPTARPQP